MRSSLRNKLSRRLRVVTILAMANSMGFLAACNDGPSTRPKSSASKGPAMHRENATIPISLAQKNELPEIIRHNKVQTKRNKNDLVLNGEELYTNLCSSCHGGAVALMGKTQADLQKAIAEVPEMENLGECFASDPELRLALFAYINGEL